jgi:immunoglobulin-binding protein 1
MESLPTVFRRALLNLSKASNLPTIQDETQVLLFFFRQPFIAELAGQELIDIALKDCRDSRARVADLALFSPNETLDDISTQDSVYLFLPYVSAEIESRARAIERDERLSRLSEAKVRHPCPPLTNKFLLYGQQGFTKFVSELELYEIVSKSEHELHGKNASAIADPARRRETKIKQYQAEKEIRTRIEVNSLVQIF